MIVTTRRTCRRRAELCTMMALLLWSSAASAGFVGDEQQVNTYTIGNQNRPVVARYFDGAALGFVVVWASRNQDGSDYGIFGQRFRTDGSTVGAEFQINTYEGGRQIFPAIASSSSFADFIVVWQDFAQDKSDSGIFAQYYSEGLPNGSEFQVNTHTLGHQGDPAVSLENRTRPIVVWTTNGQDGDGAGVFAQILDGPTREGEFQVNSYTVGHQGFPDVASDYAGNFVVVWTSYSDGDARGIFGRRFSSSGAALGTEFQLNVFTQSNQSRPAIAMADNGDFVAAWDSYGLDGDDSGVFGGRFSSSGAALGAEFQVNSQTLGFQYNPRIGRADNGDFVITWTEYAASGGANVIARRYSSAGIPGNEFRVSSYTSAYQTQADVTADGAGGFVVAWQDYYGDGSRDSVSLQRLDASDCTARPDPGCAAAGKALLLVKPEKIVAKLLKGPALTQAQLGNPLNSGGTAYSLCIYDDADLPVASIYLDRAGNSVPCGGTPCWKATGGEPPSGNGYKYKDRDFDSSSDPARLVLLKGGAAGESKVLVKGRPPETGPTSTIPAQLQGATSATIQLRGSDATACVSATLSNVTINDGTTFKAK